MFVVVLLFSLELGHRVGPNSSGVEEKQQKADTRNLNNPREIARSKPKYIYIYIYILYIIGTTRLHASGR